jgi:hypothetical protein
LKRIGHNLDLNFTLQLLKALSLDGWVVSISEDLIEFSEKVSLIERPEEACENDDNLSSSCSSSELSFSSSLSSNDTYESAEMGLTHILDGFVESGIISEENRVVTRNDFQHAVTSNYAKWRMTEDQVRI